MTASILPFPYGGRYGRSVLDPMPPLPQPAPLVIRVVFRNRDGEIVERLAEWYAREAA